MIPKFEGTTFKRGKGQPNLRTKEGVEAVHDTISYIKSAPSIKSLLKWSDNLFRVAQDHVKDIGTLGLASHESSQGLSVKDRMFKHGSFLICYGENLSFHCDTAIEVLL